MKRRLFFVAAAALLPGLGVLAYNELSYRAEREQEVHRQVAQASRQVASEISQIVEGVHGLLNAVAAIPAVKQRDVPACNEALKAVASGMAPIRVIFLLGLDGKVVCSSSDQVSGWEFAERRYFRDALATPKLVIGEHTKSRFSGVGILPIVKSIPGSDGKASGVIATGLRLDWLGQQLLERGIPNGGALTIADRDGTIISRNPDPERFVGTRIPEAFQHLVNAAEPGTLEVRSQDGEVRIIGYQPVSIPPEGLYISSGLSKSQAFAAVDRASLIGALLISVGAIAAFAAAGFVGNAFIRRPVKRLNTVLAHWRAGRPDSRTGMKAAQGDLESVGESLDALLDALARREQEAAHAERQRDLAMHELSHRVKNTLTIVQAFARQTFGPDGDKERVKAFSDRIAALAQSYDLLLSREQQAGEMRSVLAAALKPHQGLKTRIALEGPPVELTPDMVLALSMVVHELATNAVKYGALRHDDGTVSIRWSLDGGFPMRLALTWRERDGPPISPPDREGFGTKLINRAFPSELAPAIELAYPASGLVCSVSFDYAQAQDLAA